MFGVVLFLVLSLNRPGSVWCSSVSVMGRYGWTVSHGEVRLDCQSWEGTAGLSIMGRCVCELLINSRKDVDMLFIVEGVDVLSTG